MDFEKLLDPYKDGGTASNYTLRTLNGITDWLLNKKGYPLDIVGASIFMVFSWLGNGGEFKGDGSFGSKGRELDTAIRIKCDELLQERQKLASYEVFIRIYSEKLREYSNRQNVVLENRIRDLEEQTKSFGVLLVENNSSLYKHKELYSRQVASYNYCNATVNRKVKDLEEQTTSFGSLLIEGNYNLRKRIDRSPSFKRSIFKWWYGRDVLT